MKHPFSGRLLPVAVLSILLLTASLAWFATGGEAVLEKYAARQELRNYLKQLNEIYAELPALQELSMEANRQGLAGGKEEELRTTRELVARSATFTARFAALQPENPRLAAIHNKLLRVNQITHEALVFRANLMADMAVAGQSPNQNREIWKDRIAAFWAKHEEGARAFAELEEMLIAYGNSLGVNTLDYLPNLYAAPGPPLE